MRLIGHKLWSSRWLLGGFMVLFALGLVLGGVATLLRGEPGYRNYWGGSVFAPLAIVLGVAMLAIILFKWRTLNEPTASLKGKAARKARQAERAKPAVETFDEPWTGGRA